MKRRSIVFFCKEAMRTGRIVAGRGGRDFEKCDRSSRLVNDMVRYASVPP